MQTTTVGDRIRSWRRRRGGMSQKTLAELAGVSQAYISQIESGQRPLDRKSTQAAVASALNISVSQLLGRATETADPMRDRAVAHVPAIRSALVELSVGERRAPTRDPDAVRDLVRRATELRNGADYASLAPMLSPLLLDLGGHGGALAPEMVETLFAARYALKTMGYPDLAREAAELGVRIAQGHGDPAWIGQAQYSLVQAFPTQNADLGARVMAAMASDLEGTIGGGLEVYGCTHILAGFTAAIALRADDAAAHLDEAAEVARSLGEPEPYSRLSAGFNGNWFGPTQIEVWRVAVAAELGDAGAAVKVAKRIDLDALPVPNRHTYYWIDMARALAAGGKDREAMHALGKAERAAPQHFRFSMVATNLVTTLIARAKRRAVAEELATLARKLGIDPI
ncbi:MAG: helix-turn-helix domain-containing protein [Micromonosporaceae bacterium]